MKHLLTLLTAAALAVAVYAQPTAAVVPKDEKPPPVVTLPPEPIRNVAKFDPAVVKARDVPYHVTLVKAPEAWAKNPAAKGAGVKIAIVDTGCQCDHPGLGGMVKGAYNAITKKEGFGAVADGNGHGTHCAGIVHAILPEAEIYVVKALSDQGSGSVADLAHGIDYAASSFRVDVTSCSFGGPQRDAYLPPAIKRSVDLGTVVVCAAGNDGGPNDTEGFPGGYADSVSVAACDAKRQLATFSSWGPNVFTADPGVDILSTLPGDQEGEMSGTSMACPCEAGKVGSWVASSRTTKDKDRVSKYRAAVLKASPFAERNNARGYGLYTLDKITGEATAAPPPVKPTPGEKVYVLSLADLAKQGYTSVRFDLGAATTAGQAVPVASFPPQLAPQFQPAPVFSGPGTVYQGHYPPPVVYQQMPATCGPGGCPGGGCQPAPLFPLLHRVLR